MTLQQSETRDVGQARRDAATAIDKLVGPARELYEYNKTLAEAFWPDISEFHVAWIARVASELELDILRDEVIWYQGRPYVTIKGLVRLLNRHPQFDNYEMEPASEELRKAMRVAREEEQVWVCRLWRKDRTRPSIGYGRATPEDTFVGYGVIKKEEAPDQERPFRTPAVVEMAQERAIRRAAQNGPGLRPGPHRPGGGPHRGLPGRPGPPGRVLPSLAPLQRSLSRPGTPPRPHAGRA